MWRCDARPATQRTRKHVYCMVERAYVCLVAAAAADHHATLSCQRRIMARIFLLYTIFFVAVLGWCEVLAFATLSKHRNVLVIQRLNFRPLPRNTHRSTTLLQMRDASSAYWFNVNDRVRVVDNVIKAGHSLKGREGTVKETWEKCDVDPTCCCAEQVDVGMAVRVEFRGTEEDASASGSFMHYFAEEELIKVNDDSDDYNERIPFDGMSCTAFKLEHLKMGEQAKRIAAYEESNRSDSPN